MKPTWINHVFAVAAVAICSSLAVAQENKPRLAQMGVGECNATKSLADTCVKSRQSEAMNRFVDSLNEHLIVAFQQTRKFEIVAKSDLGKILEEQQVPKGLITDPSAPKALPGKIKGLDYMMLTALTDFIDAREGMFIEGMGMRVDTRTVRATAVVKIYNTTTGGLLQSVSVPVSLDEAGAKRLPREGFNNRAVDDALIEAAAVQMARTAATRVVDYLYPPKVLAVTDSQVTINRGEGSGVEREQVWEIFALGKEMVDPDTGVSLGKEEVKVGEVVITDVLPLFCKGTVRGNNTGIDAGAVARPKLAPPPSDDRRDPRDGGPRPLPPDVR